MKKDCLSLTDCKRTKRNNIIFIVIFFLYIVNSSFAQENSHPEIVLVAAVPRNFPPQYSVDENGEAVGFAIDAMDHIASMTGIKINYVIAETWTEVDQMLRTGEADLIPNLGITDARKKYFFFTSPIEVFPLTIFVLKKNRSIKGIQDLTGRKIAVVQYNVGVSLLENRNNIELIIFNTPVEALFELLSEEIDALIYPGPVLMKVAQDIDVENRIKSVGEPLLVVKRGIAVRQDNKELLNVLDSAVDNFIGTSAYKEIYNKWYGSPPLFWNVTRVAIFMGSLFFLILIAMTVWRYQGLRKLNRTLTQTIEMQKQAENELRKSEKQLKQQLHWMNVLNSVSNSIAQKNSLDSLFYVVIKHLQTSFSFAFAQISIYDDDSKYAIIKFVSSKGRAFASRLGIKEGAKILTDQLGLIDDLPQNKVSILNLKQINTASLLDEHSMLVNDLIKKGLNSVAIIPLAVRSVRFGIISMFFKQLVTFNEYQTSYLNGLGEQVFLAAQNRRLYEELEQSYDELKRTQKTVMEQERLNAMGQMASGIAHDINNTIAPICLYTEAMLESEPELSERAIRFLKTIQNATQDIEKTTSRMREFYRKHEDEIAVSSVDIKELFSQVIELTRPRWQDMPNKKGVVIQLRTELPEDLPQLMGVESDVREALVNLIFNAVDAMPEGGIIALKGQMIDPYILLEVEDTGIGMDEEMKQKCLEPFFTSKGEKGTGLGLAAVYGMTLRHDGKIEIESELGKGTSFRLFFPIKESGIKVSEPEKSAISLPSLRILCIDDDETIRNTLEEILQMDGHNVMTAGSGEEGLVIFRRQQEIKKDFDIVITDLGMPYMDGEQVAKAIKHEAPSCPVILLSGWGNFMISNGEKPIDVDWVMGKPPKLSNLRTALMTLLQKDA
jgi:signal transduction histidine kinase/ABC-type amino acid transport substrate-binding protein/ActR/RegA family two-component response regulator